MTKDAPGRTTDTLRSLILGTLLNLLRTSTLGDKVDMSEVLAFVSDQWPKLYSDGVFDLTPLYRELVDRRQASPDEVAQIFLVLKKREAKLSITVKLPAEVSGLSTDHQEKLMDSVQRTGVRSGVTMVRMPRVEPRPESAPPTSPTVNSTAGLTERVRNILGGSDPKK